MKKMLVVVDYQNDFVNGTLGFEEAKTLEDGIVKKIKEYMDRDDYVLFTFDTHFKGYLETREGKGLPIEHCIDETEGWNLYGKVGAIHSEIRHLENVYSLGKTTFGLDMSGIVSNEFDDLAKMILVSESIELIGVVTNICIISNAIALQSFNDCAEMIVDASLCASNNKDLHEKALDVMAGLQIKIINR